jgi:hypothetical protein
VRRTLAEESGVALGLAVVLIVVIGVMGAGLLTPIVADLQTMAEANRGQQAFEMAEAGIEVAKARLADTPDLAGWSSGELRLADVEEGYVVVTVERLGSEEDARFAATSLGRYGGARRKIEATFEVAGGEPRLLTWREVYA